MGLKEKIINALGGTVSNRTANSACGNDFLTYGNRQPGHNPEWSDVEHYNTIAVSVLSEKEQNLLESIGVSLESEPNNEGFRHFKRFRELRPEINAFLKNA